MNVLKGVGASSGIALGYVKLVAHSAVFEVKSKVSPDAEKTRLSSATEAAREQIAALVIQAREKMGQSEGAIFEAHLMMLDDPEFEREITALIMQGTTAEHAISETTKAFVALFEGIDDPYLKARATDLKDVSNRIIKNLQGLWEDTLSEAPRSGLQIVYGEDLTPSDTMKLDPESVCGFVTALGSVTSHSAIMARTLGIPAVVSAGNLSSWLKEGMLLGIDGDTGELFIDPQGDVMQVLLEKKMAQQAEKEALNAQKTGITRSADGKQVELACNIGNPRDLKYVLENDGEAIGLYRSEFVYMDQESPPSEAVQYEAYKAVLKGMEGKPVVIRTLDIGGDKQIAYMDFPQEENPFLGYRAIRYCLENQPFFKTQLRALLRAGYHGNLKIMVPMISSVSEVRQVKALLKECEEELKAEGTLYGEHYELGIMIEIPSAAIIADRLAKEVDFFSIGTNDLIQYTLAADRMNGKVANLYTPFHPAVLRLIHRVITEGHKAGIWVGMCGEAAGHPGMIPLLLGMGIDELSMNPSKILRARTQISTVDTSVWDRALAFILDMDTPEEIEAALEGLTYHRDSFLQTHLNE